MFLRRTRALAGVTAGLMTVGLVAACSGGGEGGEPETNTETQGAEDVEGMAEAQALVGEYPREETIFTSGHQWGPPSSWNPIPESGEATGVRGLLYEPLFLFDPFTLELTPHLAEAGEWTADDEYVLTLREGVTWQDGEAFDADDVVFSFEVCQKEGIPCANLWNWVDSVEATSPTEVTVSFSESRPQEWDRTLYTRMMLPQHIMGEWADDELMTNQNVEPAPVGTGAFTYSTHGQDRMVWERNDEWWAADALGYEMPMRYLVDIVNPSNEVALGLMLQGGLDLSNNFLPGIKQLADSGQVGTFYESEPYMLSANTAMLVPNAAEAPGNDPAFRQALAFAVNVDQIVEVAYGNIVQKASPVGLLPSFEEYYDQAVIDEHGFSYDPDQAKTILADAGYVDSDGDGTLETPDGEPIELELIVPSGWTDWMEAARVISEDLSAVGITTTPGFPDAGAVDDARTNGDFDLLLNNWAGLSNTPWTYYNYLFYHPISEQMWGGNFGRIENEPAWELVQDLARTPSDDPAFQETMSELQEMSLTEMPMVPLWYNGAWAQYNETVWSNWPTDASPNPTYPITWGGDWAIGGLLTLANLEPAS
jgi:peptide/nickel transport system substrate-binding protein